jgi:hypothetical protein
VIIFVITYIAQHLTKRDKNLVYSTGIDHAAVIGDWIVLAINSCLRLVAIFEDKLPLEYPD